MTIRIKDLLVVSMAMAFSTLTAFAKTCTWTGQGPLHNNDELYWTDAENWDENGVPVDGDTVIFETKSATKHRMNKSLTLAHLEYTSKHAAIFNGKDTQRLTILDTESKIDCEATVTWLTPITLPEGAKLTINCTDAALAFKQPAVMRGEGEIVKNGSKQILDVCYRSPDFQGKWTVNTGTIRCMAAGENVFGTAESELHIYGLLDSRYTTTIASKIFLYNGAGIYAYQDLTLNGDVTFKANAANQTFYLEGCYNNSYKTTPAAVTVNGKLICDTTSGYAAQPTFYAYARTDFRVKLNGGFEGWTKPMKTAKKSGYNVIIELNTPFETTDAGVIYLYDTDKLICGAPNVLNNKAFGFYSTSNMDNLNEVLDLNGYDQTVLQLSYNKNADYRLEGKVTSSRAPATLTVSRIYNNATQNRTFYSAFDDSVSLVLNKGFATIAGDVVFSGGSTTGWLISDWAGCDLDQAAFSNLSGIGLKGAGIAYVGATTALKNGVKLDFNGRTTGYLRVATGTNIQAAEVVDGGQFVPAGTYCRVGAGVAGATEAAWLGGDGYNGTVTVAEPPAKTFVWTGAADDGDLTNGGNWGSGTAPDLTDSTVTLDFRHATAAAPITLNGTVTVAAKMTCGDICQGAPTFGGAGMLVLSGTGTTTNRCVFTENASLAWNGTGTLVLKNSASTTAGRLLVNAGKVVLALDSSWAGKVAVADGAELEVADGSTSNVFAEETEVDLRGVLDLPAGVNATVKSVTVGGMLARRNKTYGSSASAAERQDDQHFAGAGTIVSLAQPGLILLVR